MRRSDGVQRRLWLWQLLSWTCGEVAVDSAADGLGKFVAIQSRIIKNVKKES